MNSKLGHYAIQKITKKLYQDAIDQFANKFSYNYVSNIHTSANMVFMYAKEMKLIKEVPSQDIRLPKKK